MLLAVVAGLLTTLNPCVLPVLPIVLVSALEQHRFGPLALAGGLVASFCLVSLGVYGIGAAFDVSPEAGREAGAVLMVLAGAVMLLSQLKLRVAMAGASLTGPFNRLLERATPEGLRGQWLLGLLLGAVWSPCTGPTLGAALGLASQAGQWPKAAAVMLSFSLGASVPLVAIAYGARGTLRLRRERLAAMSRYAMPATGAVLLSLGLFILSGADRVVETVLTDAMPAWLARITTRF